jgi:hypothetical protein
LNSFTNAHIINHPTNKNMINVQIIKTYINLNQFTNISRDSLPFKIFDTNSTIDQPTFISLSNMDSELTKQFPILLCTTTRDIHNNEELYINYSYAKQMIKPNWYHELE